MAVRSLPCFVLPAAALALSIFALVPQAKAAAGECGNSLPVGPLPREDTAALGNRLRDQTGTPAHWVGDVHRGEKVTVLAECGQLRRVRTAGGAEGWVTVAVLPHERQLQIDARDHDREAAYNCELQHISNLDAVDACKAALKKPSHP